MGIIIKNFHSQVKHLQMKSFIAALIVAIAAADSEWQP